MRIYVLVTTLLLAFWQDAEYFQEVVDVPGATKQELFQKGKDWLFRTYKSGKIAMQFEDVEGGKILAAGGTQTVYYSNMGMKKDAGYFKYKIELGFKDGKCRVKIDDIYYVSGEMLLKEGASFFEDFPHNWGTFGKKKNQKEWDSMKDQAGAEFNLILQHFRETMAEISNEDW